MKQIIILSIISAVAILIVSTPKITFRPFSVSFGNGWFALGILFIGIGVGFIRYQGYKQGVTEGVDGAFKYMKEVIKKQADENTTPNP